MKQLFVIYGKPATGKTELLNSLLGEYEVGFINKEQGVYVIDLFSEHSDKEDIDEIIRLFNEGFIRFIKFKANEYYKIRKIILVGNRNLNEDEVIKIRNEVNDEVLISTFEAKRY